MVNRFGDLGKGRGFFGDLRYCITEANARPGEDLIIFKNAGTVQLKSPLPNISDDLIISGFGADQNAVRRNTGGNYRILTINSGVRAQLQGVTITNGFANSTNWGGGIHNSGTLTLRGVSVEGNRADCGSCSNARGGGILNAGTLTVISSTVANNVVHGSGAFGGGIDNRPGAIMTISNSTIALNTAEDDGTYDNTVQGGGIHSSPSATLSIFSSTISGNRVVKAGSSGVYQGGGIKGDVQVMGNTIVALNSALSGPDTSGNIWSGDHNIIGGNPLLGPLQNNGGPTKTMALLPGSPAIDAGSNANAPDWDQRGTGFSRIVNDTIDIGAFEVQPSGAPVPGRDLAMLITADWDERMGG
jgi:hypothetical protein